LWYFFKRTRDLLLQDHFWIESLYFLSVINLYGWLTTQEFYVWSIVVFLLITMINHSMIMILSKFKRDTCVWFGSVLFMQSLALYFIERLFWKEVCICLMNVDLRFRATCFWLSIVVKLILVSMIILLKSCVYVIWKLGENIPTSKSLK